MSVQTAVITFAGTPLPLGSKITSRTTDSTIANVKKLSRQGSHAPVGLALAQSVIVDIDIGGGDASPTTELPLFTMDAVNDELNRLYANLANGYQQLAIGETPARFLVCQKRKSEVTYELAHGRAFASAQIEFYAVDPRWLSVALNTSTALSSAAPQTNAGNVDTFPLFTFNGPASAGAALALIVGTPASTQYEIVTTTVLAPTDVLVINCDPRCPSANRIMLNGVPRYDLIATISNTVGDDYPFPRLMPGISTISATGGFAATSSIAFRDAYAL